jgi:Porin subfamily
VTPNVNRGFIQWAGFTFGQAVSFFDFYQIGALSYLPAYPASSTGGAGWGVLAYTAQFGNGFSGTISAEDRRTTQIINTAAGLAPGAQGGGAGGYGGWQAPDIVGNLRVDQAWGSAQVMAAWHDVNTTYYTNAGAFQGLASGHPSDESGWALGGGLKLNAPMIGRGDYFMAQVGYTEGATGYVFSPQISAFNWYKREGDTAAYGIMSDAVYGGTIAGGTASSLNLTTAWGVNAAFEHNWNDQWKSDILGGYAEVTYNNQANAIMCSLEGDGAGAGTAAVANAGCDNNFNIWWIGSRTQWNVTKDFYLGVDVLYESLQSASTSNGILPVTQQQAFQGAPRSLFVGNEDNLSFEFRAHKDFYP